MGAIGILKQWLRAEISASNLKRLADFLLDRLGSKSMEISIEYTTKDGTEYKIEVTARNEKELQEALGAAMKFINVNED